MEKEIIILAKSSKHNGFCIAGVDAETGEWVRPISSNEEEEGAVPLTGILYEDGTEIQVLDRVKIKLLEPVPTNVQPENYRYDESYYWVKTGTATIEEVISQRGYDEVDQIFYNYQKEVDESEISGQPSLLLLRVHNAYICVKTFKRKKYNYVLNIKM